MVELAGFKQPWPGFLVFMMSYEANKLGSMALAGLIVHFLLSLFSGGTWEGKCGGRGFGFGWCCRI